MERIIRQAISEALDNCAVYEELVTLIRDQLDPTEIAQGILEDYDILEMAVEEATKEIPSQLLPF